MIPGHAKSACPCRKGHKRAPAPPIPVPPKGWPGKVGKKVRDALDDGDDARVAHLTAGLPGAAGFLMDCRSYFAAREEWHPDLCRACGVSCFVVNLAPGCGQCVPDEIWTTVESLTLAVARGAAEAVMGMRDEMLRQMGLPKQQ